MAFVPVTDSLGNPVLASNGTQRVACTHLAEWLVAYDALQVARGRGHVTYYQTMGGADASAGTHNCGSAWDMAWMGDAAIMDAREMGAAQWHRIPGRNGWPSSGTDHGHGLIRCGDNGCNDYQYAAWLNGWNGLGLGGQGAGDPLPKPVSLRTWQQGIIWAHAEIARLAGTTTTEDDMPIFMRTTDTSIWLLKPGAPPRGLSLDEWNLWARLGATLVGGDFNMQQVNMVSATMQPAPVTVTVPPVTIDPKAIEAALANVTFTTRKA